MFTRTSPPQPPAGIPNTPDQTIASAPLEPADRRSTPGPAQPARPAPIPATATAPQSNVSVIGSDLAIMGTGLRIVSQGTLQVDGTVRGDVLGSTVVISENGNVTGEVHAETVTIHGTVEGSVKGVTVSLKSGARVDGDLYHASLGIEEGASFDGRSRRVANAGDLKPNLDPNAPPETDAGGVRPLAALPQS